MSSKKDFIVFERLRAEGEPEEQAFLHATNGEMHDLVTKKDLKISFLEFAKENKLEAMSAKINLIFLAIGGLYAFLWYLLEKMPK